MSDSEKLAEIEMMLIRVKSEIDNNDWFQQQQADPTTQPQKAVSQSFNKGRHQVASKILDIIYKELA